MQHDLGILHSYYNWLKKRMIVTVIKQKKNNRLKKQCTRTEAWRPCVAQPLVNTDTLLLTRPIPTFQSPAWLLPWAHSWAICAVTEVGLPRQQSFPVPSSFLNSKLSPKTDHSSSTMSVLYPVSLSTTDRDIHDNSCHFQGISYFDWWVLRPLARHVIFIENKFTTLVFLFNPITSYVFTFSGELSSIMCISMFMTEQQRH